MRKDTDLQILIIEFRIQNLNYVSCYKKKMLLNVSHNDPEIRQKINNEVGKSFSLRERIRMGGIGSPKLHITECSIQIHNLLILDNRINTCNIELRPKGIIVGFGVKLETYALVIPYYKLALYKGKAEEYSIYRDTYYVKVKAGSKDRPIHKFMQKVLASKADQAHNSFENL